MKKRVTLITVAALLLLTAFLLIMTRLHSPEEVLAPPNPNGEYRQLQEAFEQAVGSGAEYKLQYPTEGDFRSAFVLEDLDGDGENEAIVFYSNNSDDSVVRMNLLDNRDDKWVSVLDEAGYGSKINSVDFQDLNGDGPKEVLLSWSLIGTDSSRTMTIHSVNVEEGSKATFTSLANFPYKAMNVLDMDNDGNPEILVVWNETTQKVQHNYAALMKMTSTGLRQLGEEAVLDSTASVYTDFVVQEGKTPMVFLDALKGDNTMFTEVLWWDGVNQKMRAPFTENATNTNMATLRSPAVESQDIDNDGIVEIPVAYGLNGSESLAGNQRSSGSQSKEEEARLYLTGWSVTGTADPGTLTPKAYSYVNEEEHYLLTVDSSYRNSLLAYRNTKTGVLTVYSVNDNGTRKDPLFSLVMKNNDDMKKSDTYTFIQKNETRSVFGTLTSAGKEAGFTDELIQNSLILT